MITLFFFLSTVVDADRVVLLVLFGRIHCIFFFWNLTSLPKHASVESTGLTKRALPTTKMLLIIIVVIIIRKLTASAEASCLSASSSSPPFFFRFKLRELFFSLSLCFHLCAKKKKRKRHFAFASSAAPAEISFSSFFFLDYMEL